VLAAHHNDSAKINDAQREIAKHREAVHALERRVEKQSALIRALCELLYE
jgi:hypothetical protein